MRRRAGTSQAELVQLCETWAARTQLPTLLLLDHSPVPRAWARGACAVRERFAMRRAPAAARRVVPDFVYEVVLFRPSSLRILEMWILCFRSGRYRVRIPEACDVRTADYPCALPDKL